MGTFSADMEIGDRNGTGFETVNALVDTGATYTVLPASLLRSLRRNAFGPPEFHTRQRPTHPPRHRRDIGPHRRTHKDDVGGVFRGRFSRATGRVHLGSVQPCGGPGEPAAGSRGRAGYGARNGNCVRRLLNQQRVAVEGDGAVAEFERSVSIAAQLNLEVVQPAGDFRLQAARP